jgi:DNA-binding NarL/FixJ family response regulator
MRINVLICSQTLLYAEGLKRILEDDDEIKVIGVACDEDELKKKLRLNQDVVIADQASYKTLSGLPKDEPFRILLINDNSSFSLPYRDLQDVVSKGLVGIISNNSDSDLLKKAIKTVHSGDLWIDRQTINKALHRGNGEKKDKHLTKKEMEILHFLCAGYTNREISEKLSITEPTVKSHVNHLFKKFGVSNRLKLAISASSMESTR